MAQFSVTFLNGVQEFDEDDAQYVIGEAGQLVIDEGGRRTTHAAGQWLRITEDTPQGFISFGG